jgi:hypothetical protein
VLIPYKLALIIVCLITSRMIVAISRVIVAWNRVIYFLYQ